MSQIRMMSQMTIMSQIRIMSQMRIMSQIRIMSQMRISVKMCKPSSSFGSFSQSQVVVCFSGVFWGPSRRSWFLACVQKWTYANNCLHLHPLMTWLSCLENNLICPIHNLYWNERNLLLGRRFSLRYGRVPSCLKTTNSDGVAIAKHFQTPQFDAVLTDWVAS